MNFEAPEAEGESPAGEAAGGRDIWGLQTRSTCRSPASSLLLTDDDSNSYENVLVCKPSTPESGVEDFEDYQNSVSIHQWRESKRTMGAPMSLSGSPDEEPDYVNGDVAAAENI